MLLFMALFLFRIHIYYFICRNIKAVYSLITAYIVCRIKETLCKNLGVFFDDFMEKMHFVNGKNNTNFLYSVVYITHVIVVKFFGYDIMCYSFILCIINNVY